jgi:hypothetical protein
MCGLRTPRISATPEHLIRSATAFSFWGSGGFFVANCHANGSSEAAVFAICVTVRQAVFL